MTERVYVRPVENGLWQWRVFGGQEQNDSEEYTTGDHDALYSSLPSPATPVHLIVPGANVISCKVPLENVDKKHIAKMLPFELEDKVIDSVEDIHLSFGEAANDEIPVYYMKSGVLSGLLEPLTEAGCEVTECVPDFALIEQDPAAISIVYDGKDVFVSVGDSQSFTTDAALAPLLFQRLEFDFDTIHKLVLSAETHDQLDELHGWIPDSWEDDDGLELVINENGFWDSIQTQGPLSKLNLRRGDFARRLPFERWFTIWKIPAIFVLVAFILSVVVLGGEYLTAKAEAKNIRKTIQDVYLQAVPNGKKGDEEGRLRALLKSSNVKTSEPTNLMYLLSTMAEVMNTMDSVKLTSFRYSGDQKELQASIEVNNLAELNQFKERMEAAGLSVGSPRSSAQGDIYQARLKVTEKAQ